MALPEFAFGETNAINPFEKKPVTIDALKKAAEEKAAREAAIKQADELDKKRLDAVADAKAALPRSILLDETKDPEVELRAKEAREAMATDPGVKARAAAAAVPESVDRYQRDIEAKRPLPDTPDNGVQKYQDTIEAGRVRAMPEAEARKQAEIETKSPADAATEIASAPPSKVDQVIDKLKEEEKKGGPNFFDVLEAAAAGWNGKVPLYVQKAVKAKEQEENLQLLQKQEEAQKAERIASYEQERELQKEKAKADIDLFNRDVAAKRELAGLAPLTPVAGTGGLSLGEFSAFGGK